jgi:phage baseplate assembly protein W
MPTNSNLYTKISLPAAPNNAQAVASKMYKGFSTVSLNTENFSLYDLELIKQDLLNHFYVRQGERLMNPTFGTIIWDLLFEPLTEQIKDLILQNVNQIINYDPRVKAESVIVTAYESGIQVECQLTYLSYNLSESIRLRFDQENGLLAQ